MDNAVAVSEPQASQQLECEVLQVGTRECLLRLDNPASNGQTAQASTAQQRTLSGVAQMA